MSQWHQREPQTHEELEEVGDEECLPGRSNREDFEQRHIYIRSYSDPVRPTRARKGRRGTVLFVAGLVRPASVYRPMAQVVSLAIYRLARWVRPDGLTAIESRGDGEGETHKKTKTKNKMDSNSRLSARLLATVLLWPQSDPSLAHPRMEPPDWTTTSRPARTQPAAARRPS